MMATAYDREPHGEPQEKEGPQVSTRAYVLSFGALLGLTLLSYWLSYRNLGEFSTPVALAIAVVKDSIVALFFMGLVDEPASHRVIGITAVLFVILLAALAAADVVTRF
jgi:cytochrome c oxidase subunit 4